MRCLVVADLHYSLPQYDWVVNSASKFDIVIIAGDHLDLSSHVDMRAQVVVMRKYFEILKTKTRLIVCSGNHDLDLRDEFGEKVASWISNVGHEGIAADGQSYFYEDNFFSICPWWDGPLLRERVALQLAADSAKRSQRWIWIYHAPSHDSPTSWTGSKHWGDSALLEWINLYQPDFVFSGHVHQSPFVKDGSWVDRIGKTWVFNVGQHAGAPPPHIIIDTDFNEAFWSSAAGMQSVRLDQTLSRPLAKLMTPPSWVTSEDREADPNPG